MQQAQITAFKKRYNEKVERRNKEKRNKTDEQIENFKNATGTYHNIQKEKHRKLQQIELEKGKNR